MPFIETFIRGLKIFEPQIWEDERGYFYESYNKNTFVAADIHVDFIQDNQAKSSYGVLRGLHFQTGDWAQTKLVRVISGEVFDVAVDLRKDSVTYGKWAGVLLSGENKKQFLVPRGFAHGYVVLSKNAIFSYKCDNFYSKAHEGGIRFDDPVLAIDWHIAPHEAILSEKDKMLPFFSPLS